MRPLARRRPPLLDSMLRVDLTALDDGLHEMELSPAPGDLDLDPGIFADIAVALRLDIAERRVRAAYATRATATLECDRTLAEYQQSVEGSHEVLFTDAPIGEEAEDVYPLPEHPPEVDLTEPVRDTLLLALPLRRVAPEAEDAEIPTRFGGPVEGEPADDRWEALRRLRDDTPDDTTD
ncbi:MAG: DUF177 domain-containing protein [Bacteroidota bacterium]